MRQKESYESRCASIEASADNIVNKTCNDDEKQKQIETKIEYLIHLCATYQEQAAKQVNRRARIERY